jgi:hypothetical protein
MMPKHSLIYGDPFSGFSDGTLNSDGLTYCTFSWGGVTVNATSPNFEYLVQARLMVISIGDVVITLV